MTIKSKLVLSTAITIVGLVVVVSLSIYAIGSIRTTHPKTSRVIASRKPTV